MLNLFKKQGFRPRAGVWELTLRCNMNCLHCGSRAGKPRRDELTLDELLRLADDLAELGGQAFTLSGGEPLLRKEWPQVARRLSDHGVRANMISNGFAFREATLDLARESGLVNMAFSVDGDEAIHEKIRAKPGSFRRVMEAIDICVRNDFPVSVVSHVTNANLYKLDEMAQMLIDKGVTMWQVQGGFDFGNLSDHPDLILEPSALEVFVPKVVELMERHRGVLRIDPADDVGYFTDEDAVLRANGEDEGYWMGCQAGLTVIGIEANGNIKGCLSMQSDDFVEGNIRQESLREIWFKEGNFAYTRQYKAENLGGFCRECAYNDLCRGGCSWNAYLHGRDIGKFANKYCLYQVRELRERGE